MDKGDIFFNREHNTLYKGKNDYGREQGFGENGESYVNENTLSKFFKGYGEFDNLSILSCILGNTNNEVEILEDLDTMVDILNDLLLDKRLTIVDVLRIQKYLEITIRMKKNIDNEDLLKEFDYYVDYMTIQYRGY